MARTEFGDECARVILQMLVERSSEMVQVLAEGLVSDIDRLVEDRDECKAVAVRGTRIAEAMEARAEAAEEALVTPNEGCPDRVVEVIAELRDLTQSPRDAAVSRLIAARWIEDLMAEREPVMLREQEAEARAEAAEGWVRRMRGGPVTSSACPNCAGVGCYLCLVTRRQANLEQDPDPERFVPTNPDSEPE